MTKPQSIDPGVVPPRARPSLIDRCATSLPATIIVAVALTVPVVAVIDALRG